MVYKFFEKKAKGTGLKNQQLAKSFIKELLERFKKENCILLLRTILGC